MKNQVQLITYADRLGVGSIQTLHELMKGPFQGLFGGIHLLPFYTPFDGADAGFDPIDHGQVDPRLGNWEDIKSLSGDVDVMADLIVNHVSVDSPQFQDFLAKGEESEYAGMFLTFDGVFPNGANEDLLTAVNHIRPELPFTLFHTGDGRMRVVWTTFTSKQIDIDIEHPQGIAYLDSILSVFEENGIKVIRMDAAPHVIKKAGTSCFMLPETFDFIEAFTKKANSKGIDILVEVHAYYKEQIEIAKKVDYVYDFALPPLVLHTLFTKNTNALKRWLSICPRNALTVLDTHDGIGVIDAGPGNGQEGLISEEEQEKLVLEIHERSGGESEKASGNKLQNLDTSQINCTFYDALGQKNSDYLLARAIQFFAPGIPQVYYVGLLAGKNDLELMYSKNTGRAINRHYFSSAEIEEAVQRPVVQELFELIRFRNSHPAFNGEFSIEPSPDHLLILKWESGESVAKLMANMETGQFEIFSS